MMMGHDNGHVTPLCMLCKCEMTSLELHCAKCNCKVHATCVYPGFDSSLVLNGALSWNCQTCMDQDKTLVGDETLVGDGTTLQDVAASVAELTKDIVEIKNLLTVTSVSADQKRNTAFNGKPLFSDIIKNRSISVRKDSTASEGNSTIGRYSTVSEGNSNISMESIRKKRKTDDVFESSRNPRRHEPAPVIAVGKNSEMKSFRSVPEGKVKTAPRRHVYIGMAHPDTTEEQIKEHCQSINVNLLHIRKVNKPESRYNSFHAIFKETDVNTVENEDNWPPGIIIGRYRLNKTAWDWLYTLPKSDTSSNQS